MNDPVIVCIGGRWTGLPSRRQAFMSRLSENGFRILYLEPSVSFGRDVDGEGCRSPLVGYLRRQVMENVTAISPPSALPFRHSSLSGKLNLLRWSSIIRKELQTMGVSSAKYLWVYDSRWFGAVSMISHETLVFDMVDDFLSHDYGGRVHRMGTLGFFRKAELVIFTSEELRKKYGHLTSECVVVPNGYDSSLFREGIAPRPDDLPKVKGPIALHVGTIFKHLDYEVMGRIASRVSERGGCTVLLGRTELEDKAPLHRLTKEKGCLLLEPKPHSSIPSYIANADICMAVFRKGRVAASVSPLKLYEYLGCGVPSITQGLTGFREDPLYDFTYDLDVKGITEALDGALRETASTRTARANTARRLASWDSRFDSLMSFLTGTHRTS